MSDSDLLITDNSGISIEFLLGLKKPVIILTDMKKYTTINIEISTYVWGPD